MKQARLLLIIIAIALLHLPVNAKLKTMKYADNIQYYGEVDKNKQPLGKGRLQLIGYAGYALDIIYGDFEGEKITNAEVLFGSSIWPNDPTDAKKRTAKYTGTLEFGVKEANGRTFLVYNLTDGILRVNKHRTYDNIFDQLSISCKPQDHCAVERSASTDNSEVYQIWSGNFHKEDGDVEYVYKFYNNKRYGNFDYGTEERMSKAKEERLKAEAEQKMKTPKGLAERIVQLIDDTNQPFSDVVSMTDKLLAMEDTIGKKEAIRSVIQKCMVMHNSLHKGTERGKQEWALNTKLYKYLIKDGNTEDLINYAYHCLGLGDTEKGKQYFQQAVDKGSTEAISALASWYENMEKNNEKAIEWYTKLLETDASEQTAIKVMDYFRKINRPDLIFKTLEKCASGGNRDAMLRIGDIYRNGHDWSSKKTGITVKKDYVTAIKWYKKAHDVGSRAALFFMADCYWKGGNGVTQNRAQAGKLYQQMMNEAGIFNVRITEAEPEERSEASYQFGYCLETGTGVVKDMNRAWNFYCDSYEADAYYRRAVMLERKWVKERLRPDYRMQECRELYQMAANKGHKQAQQALNRTYR